MRPGKKKSPENDKKAKKEAKRAAAEPPELPIWVLAAVAAAVFAGGRCAGVNNFFYSEVEGRMHFMARLMFFLAAQAVSTQFFIILFLQIGRRLCGESSPTTCSPTSSEQAVHDPSISWPAVELLSNELKPFASNKGQPFSLNHVTGRRRCKDACMRIGMMLGSLVTVWCMCLWMEKRPISQLGLTMDRPFFLDAAIGMGVGVTIVTFMFIIELLAGWLHFLQFFEVFDKSENFGLCIFWDVVFHLNVSVNEELPIRGWLLHNFADALVAHQGLSYTPALVLAMIAQSVFFVLMHLNSPGGSRLLSMLNIFVGGMAGGLNVLCTGGRLGFTLGWHFGWNISMGNVLGLSTSGIPISATFIAVAPHPEKQALHGGVFGPEGGVVSPAAYTLGVLLLFFIYGVPSLGVAPIS